MEMDARLGSPRYRLFSCHGSYLNYAVKTLPLCATLDNEFEIMLDSGAFTAWSKGEEVTVQHIIDVYSRLLDKFGHLGRGFWLINLDKIPGAPGVTASTPELQDAIKISDENFHLLVDKFGDIVLPVFHQNEDNARLSEVVGMGKYICVSPRNDLPETMRREWSQEVHALLTRETWTHGLAATGHPMMTKVPWTSVDSATWIMIAAYGRVYANHRLSAVGISVDSATRYEKENHIDNLNYEERNTLLQMIEDRGFDLELLQTDFVERSIWNRVIMSELYRGIDHQSITHVQESLLDL